MIIRSVLRCSATRRLTAIWPRILPAKPRSYSTSTSSTTTSPAVPPSISMLAPFANELDRIAPKFEIHGSQVQILSSPSEFYESLKSKILSAERQIFLSTLYIGKTEHELISLLQQALRSKPNLRLSILTDALRGTREAPEPSCASLLVPLVAEFGPERVEIRMYHTPNLTGLRKRFIPKRINEGWGLQHMKLYGFDDEIVLSGANLSNDYFTNRQDRYHVFSSMEITEYYFKLHSAVSNLSFLIIPDSHDPSGFTLDWPSSNSAPSPLENPSEYRTRSSAILTPLIQPQSQPQFKLSASTSHKTLSPSTPPPNTTIYPLAQLTPNLPSSADTSTELPALTSLLTLLTSLTHNTSSWTFTAGYFNPHPTLTSLLLRTTSSSNVVLTASPYANGFYGSKGVSGLLPAAYTLLTRRFLNGISSSHRESTITLKEWRRGTVNTPGGWTYHAKGLWISLAGQAQPSISVIGSSNYTKRSYSLDLEVGAVVVTADEGLKERLGKERDGLGVYAQSVGLEDLRGVERRVGVGVRIALWIVGIVGGAL